MDNTLLRRDLSAILNELEKLRDTTSHLLRQLSQPQNDNQLKQFFADCRIQHPVRGSIPLKLYEYQLETLNTFESSDFVIINKARQMGLTAITALYALYLASTYSNYQVIIVSNRLSSSLEVFGRAAYAAEYGKVRLPFVTMFSKDEIKFANGSSILARSASRDTLKEKSEGGCVIIDEAAYISHKTLDDFWVTLMPFMKASKVIMSSTPKTNIGLFARLWREAEFNGASPLLIPWHRHPERDENWATNFKQQLGSTRFSREFECLFIEDDPID